MQVYLVAEEGSEDEYVERMLDQYAQASDRVTVEQVDPALHPTFTDQYTSEDVADEAGDVSLMLTRARRDAELTVRNPCVELDASETDRLFERFYRPDPSRERGTGGYGIGLSIARSVTERRGGKIRAKKVGDDLEIVVTLPLAR